MQMNLDTIRYYEGAPIKELINQLLAIWNIPEVKYKQHSTLDRILQLGAQHNMLQKLNNPS